LTRSNLKKFFYIVLIGLGIVLLVGGRGILNIKKIYSENLRIEKNIVSLKESNKKLEEEISLLRHNTAYQERVIREVLGFSKEDEIVYEFE